MKDICPAPGFRMYYDPSEDKVFLSNDIITDESDLFYHDAEGFSLFTGKGRDSRVHRVLEEWDFIPVEGIEHAKLVSVFARLDKND